MNSRSHDWRPGGDPRCMTCGKPSATVRCPECAARIASYHDRLIHHDPMDDLPIDIWDHLSLNSSSPEPESRPESEGDLLFLLYKKARVWARGLRETQPPATDWSGLCPWCARELRERSGDEVTYIPPRARIQTCGRHRRGLLALSRWLREQTFRQGGH